MRSRFASSLAGVAASAALSAAYCGWVGSRPLSAPVTLCWASAARSSASCLAAIEVLVGHEPVDPRRPSSHGRARGPTRRRLKRSVAAADIGTDCRSGSRPRGPAGIIIGGVEALAADLLDVSEQLLRAGDVPDRRRQRRRRRRGLRGSRLVRLEIGIAGDQRVGRGRAAGSAGLARGRRRGLTAAGGTAPIGATCASAGPRASAASAVSQQQRASNAASSTTNPSFQTITPLPRNHYSACSRARQSPRRHSRRESHVRDSRKPILKRGWLSCRRPMWECNEWRPVSFSTGR